MRDRDIGVASRSAETSGLRSLGFSVRLGTGAQEGSEQFWAKVDRTGGPAACWPYLKRRTKRGYGQTVVGSRRDGTRRIAQAHAVAYEIAHGPLAEGMEIRHSCHNRACCNPAHLVPGTHAENMADMVAAGRSLAGERNHIAKLTAPEVLAIRRRRARGEKAGDLAREYGVSDSLISQIATRRLWRHLPEVRS